MTDHDGKSHTTVAWAARYRVLLHYVPINIIGKRSSCMLVMSY